jgi:hypothetical protein
MTTTLAPAASFDIGRVISRLFGVLGRNLASFLALSVLLVGIPTALLTTMQLSVLAPFIGATPGDPTAVFSHLFSPLNVGLFVATLVVTVAANAVLQGAVIHGAVSDLAGRRATFGESLGVGMRFFLPLMGIGILAALGYFCGLLVLVVPGVLLALAWSVAAPAEVMERTGVFGAFGRSIELTRNHRGAIFGLAIILIVVQFVIQIVTQGVIGAGMGARALAPGVGGTAGVQGYLVAQSVVALVSRTIGGVIGAAGTASVYYELRQVKEGVGAEQLASVFD